MPAEENKAIVGHLVEAFQNRGEEGAARSSHLATVVELASPAGPGHRRQRPDTAAVSRPRVLLGRQ